MRTKEFWKYFENNPTGQSLTVSVDHTESSATATIYPTGLILVDVTTASAGTAAAATINTPVDFTVQDVFARNAAGVVGTYSVDVKNNTTAITDSMSINGDNDVVRPSTIDYDQIDFSKDDDDLVVSVSGSSAGEVIVALTINFA